MLLSNMLDYDGCLFQPSLSRHNRLENMKDTYMFCPFYRQLFAVNDRSL